MFKFKLHIAHTGKKKRLVPVYKKIQKFPLLCFAFALKPFLFQCLIIDM